MKDACSIPVAPAIVPSFQVQTIWDVDAGAAYDVRRLDPPADRLIAVRTRKGAGRVFLTDGPPVDLCAGSAVILSNRRIRRYHCVGARWAFWWIEFTVAGGRSLPVGAVQLVPPWPEEAREFRALFVQLRRQMAAQRVLAAARFAGLLFRWMENAAGDAPRSRHEEVITRMVDRILDRTGEVWPVCEMARAAGMSERGFRNAFREVTGVSPKVFYDRTRLSFAEELLKLGTRNVSEIAAQLGFSSPFHFSKAFKRQYGLPPARLLPRREHEARGSLR